MPSLMVVTAVGAHLPGVRNAVAGRGEGDAHSQASCSPGDDRCERKEFRRPQDHARLIGAAVDGMATGEPGAYSGDVEAAEAAVESAKTMKLVWDANRLNALHHLNSSVSMLTLGHEGLVCPELVAHGTHSTLPCTVSWAGLISTARYRAPPSY